MIAERSAGVMELQRAISGTLRPQPSQSPETLSMMQTLMQGVSKRSSDVVVRRAPVILKRRM